MAEPARLVRSDGNLAAGVLGAAVLVGLGVAAVTYARDRSARRNGGVGARGAALAAYLREHLTASDAAIEVVERLRLTYAGSQEGRLFASLFDEFREERDVVRLIVEQIGVPAPSLKRLAGPASGAALMLANGAERDELSLFRSSSAWRSASNASAACGGRSNRCWAIRRFRAHAASAGSKRWPFDNGTPSKSGGGRWSARRSPCCGSRRSTKQSTDIVHIRSGTIPHLHWWRRLPG